MHPRLHGPAALALAACALVCPGLALAGNPGPLPFTPEEDKAYFGDLCVTVTGVKEGTGAAVEGPKDAHVMINGRRVGFAPYADGLPAGSYSIEVVRDGKTLAAAVVTIEAGKTHALDVKVAVPLTAEERAAMDAVLRKATEKRAAEVVAELEQRRAQWEVEAAKAREKRFPYLVSATVLSIAGLGLVIGGGVAQSMSFDQDDEARSRYDDWKAQTDPEARADDEKDVNASRDARDLDNALGTSFLVIGGAAMVAGVVLFIIMPRVPDEPEALREVSHAGGPTLSAIPLVAPDVAGAALEVRF
jgi:hypothetical protein